MNSLVALTRFEEARQLSDTFPDIHTNAKLVVFRARTYISEGQKEKAIQIMRAFADQGLYDLELYKILIELIQGDHPNLAYQYAKELYLSNPEDKNVVRFAGNIAIMTGHQGLHVLDYVSDGFFKLCGQNLSLSFIRNVFQNRCNE